MRQINFMNDIYFASMAAANEREYRNCRSPLYFFSPIFRIWAQLLCCCWNTQQIFTIFCGQIWKAFDAIPMPTQHILRKMHEWLTTDEWMGRNSAEDKKKGREKKRSRKKRIKLNYGQIANGNGSNSSFSSCKDVGRWLWSLYWVNKIWFAEL